MMERNVKIVKIELELAELAIATSTECIAV